MRKEARTPTVSYEELSDGSIAINVTGADAKELRINSFPQDIQTAAMVALQNTLTLDERHKLRAAQDIGEPIYTAVWDDLLSKRAEALLAERTAQTAKMENGRHDHPEPHFRSYRDGDRGF